MESSEQMEISVEEEQEEPTSTRPEPKNRFICHDCQDKGNSPLFASVMYYVRVDHELKFDEETGEYHLVKTIGDFHGDVTFSCCVCGYDVPIASLEEETKLAAAAGAFCYKGRAEVELNHETGSSHINWER